MTGGEIVRAFSSTLKRCIIVLIDLIRQVELIEWRPLPADQGACEFHPQPINACIHRDADLPPGLLGGPGSAVVSSYWRPQARLDMSVLDLFRVFVPDFKTQVGNVGRSDLLFVPARDAPWDLFTFSGL